MDTIAISSRPQIIAGWANRLGRTIQASLHVRVVYLPPIQKMINDGREWKKRIESEAGAIC